MPGRRSTRREAAEADLHQADQYGRMADAITEALRQSRPERDFKPPKFDGSDDVELFISQFQEVAEANQWSAGSARLHLREVLKDGAKSCGRGETTDAIFAALRTKFGLTVREARSRLNLKKEVKVSLQDHAAEIERLANIAYADLPEHHRANMALDAFSMTLGNTYLQRHLLAVGAQTLGEAVQAGNDFLQIQPFNPRLTQRSTIMAIEGEEEDDPKAAQVDLPQATKSATLEDVLVALKELTTLTTGLAVNGSRPRSQGRTTPEPQQIRRATSCWECGIVGHVRRQCPQMAATQPARNQQQGNGHRPQQ